MDKKHLNDLQNLEAVEATMKWYGWGSPIGLSIFFLTIALIACLIFVTFFK